MADQDKFSEHADPFCFRYEQYYEHKYINNYIIINKPKKEQLIQYPTLLKIYLKKLKIYVKKNDNYYVLPM